MDYWALALGVLISTIAYLASRSYEDIKEDLKELKKSQYITNERLVRIESKEEHVINELTSNRDLVQHAHKTIVSVSSSLEEMKTETKLSLNEAKYDIVKTKDNFGKVILILKGMVQKTKPDQGD
jgi:hypothetical protein